MRRLKAIGVLMAAGVLAAACGTGSSSSSSGTSSVATGVLTLDNAVALQKAEGLSVTDDLTRLYNSRYLNLVLRRESKRASRSG